MVPTFTMQSIGQVGARLYPGSIATATPQTFTVASPPLELDGFGVQQHHTEARHHQCTAHRPISTRFEHGFAITGRQTPIHHNGLHLLTLLAGHAPSGSTDTLRLRRGRLPPAPPIHGTSYPQLHRASATARWGRSLTTPRSPWRLVAHSSLAKKIEAARPSHESVGCVTLGLGESRVSRLTGGWVVRPVDRP